MLGNMTYDYVLHSESKRNVQHQTTDKPDLEASAGSTSIFYFWDFWIVSAIMKPFLPRYLLAIVSQDNWITKKRMNQNTNVQFIEESSYRTSLAVVKGFCKLQTRGNSWKSRLTCTDNYSDDEDGYPDNDAVNEVGFYIA